LATYSSKKENLIDFLLNRKKTILRIHFTAYCFKAQNGKFDLSSSVALLEEMFWKNFNWFQKENIFFSSQNQFFYPQEQLLEVSNLKSNLKRIKVDFLKNASIFLMYFHRCTVVGNPGRWSLGFWANSWGCHKIYGVPYFRVLLHFYDQIFLTLPPLLPSPVCI